jgi:hypothetical protein
MLDKNVGDALLKLDLSPQTETPSTQIERIIDTDRRQVRRWTRIAIGLWILAAVGAFLIFIISGFVFPAIAKMIMEENQMKVADESTKTDATADETAKAVHSARGTLENPNTPFTLLAKFTAMCMVFGTASFMLLVFAGLATVLLLTRSRTATFRQINANLLQISEQLKRLPPTQPGS